MRMFTAALLTLFLSTNASAWSVSIVDRPVVYQPALEFSLSQRGKLFSYYFVHHPKEFQAGLTAFLESERLKDYSKKTSVDVADHLDIEVSKAFDGSGGVHPLVTAKLPLRTLSGYLPPVFDARIYLPGGFLLTTIPNCRNEAGRVEFTTKGKSVFMQVLHYGRATAYVFSWYSPSSKRNVFVRCLFMDEETKDGIFPLSVDRTSYDEDFISDAGSEFGRFYQALRNG